MKTITAELFLRYLKAGNGYYFLKMVGTAFIPVYGAANKPSAVAAILTKHAEGTSCMSEVTPE